MSKLQNLSQTLLPVIEADLKQAIERHALAGHPLYAQMLSYHMGWVDQDGMAARGSSESGSGLAPCTPASSFLSAAAVQ